MPLSDIVNVQITRETQTVSQAGFGTLMILGLHKAFNERIKFYSNMTEVSADFSSYQPEYIAAQDVFSQSPRPVQLAIGRRAADTIDVIVETAQSPFLYTVSINGNDVTKSSLPTAQESTVVLDADLISGNYIGVTLNSAAIETINSVVTFDIDFVASNSIVATVNGTPLSPVPFNTDQATTMSDLAVAIQADSSVTSATVTDTREITIVFAALANNVLDSVVTTGGATQPTATIFSSQFLFDTDHLTTMQDIATAIEAEPNISSVSISDANNRTLTVYADPNQNGIINDFSVNGGVSQANATITNNTQSVSKLTIADTLVSGINALTLTLGVTATDNNDGTFSITSNVAGTAFTCNVSTNIVNPNEVKVEVSQARPSTTYTITLNGVETSVTSSATIYDNETIATLLYDALEANSLVTQTIVDNLDGTLTISSSSPFAISVTEQILTSEFGLILGDVTASDTVTNDLDAIQNENSDWYALAYTDRTQAIVESIAAWTESQTKIFGTASSNSDIIDIAVGADTTSIAAVLNQLGYVRTFVMYHDDADSDFPECAWFGRVLPTLPGSVNWKFKTLASISYSDLTTTQSQNARNKKANTYEFIGGVGITREGTMAQGEFIDIIRGVDWLTAQIQQNVYALLVNVDKVPYTDAGIASVEAEIRRALELGINNNFIAENPAYTISVPKASEVSAANKAARLLQDVSFQATLSGAINVVEINGIVSV